MKNQHERQIERIEDLMGIGQEDDLIRVFVLGQDGKPLPGKPPKLIFGTDATRAAALMKWQRDEIRRLKDQQ